MNIVIAGGGKVGSELTGKLSAEGHEITLIDNNADVLENIMSKYDVIAIQGNAASLDTLPSLFGQPKFKFNAILYIFLP